ncbi:hypothetical protein ACWM35_09700 [Neobacillus sp. K501]
MNNYPIILSSNEPNAEGNGYKIIEINVSDPIENVYAVVTPVQKQ